MNPAMREDAITNGFDRGGAEYRLEAVEIDTTELKDSIIRVESMIKELREMSDGEDA